MSRSPPKKIILIRETSLQSWLHDASTFVLVVALVGIGIYLESTPLQWIGAIMAFITISVRAAGLKEKNSFTVDEARVRLEELDGAA